MQNSRVTRIGGIALAVSVIAASGTYAFVWMLSYSDTANDGGWGQLGDGVVFVAMGCAILGVPAAIALNIVAGTRGLPNRIVGFIGGIILLAPISVLWFGFPVSS